MTNHSSYCWGTHYQPALALDQTDDRVLVRLETGDRWIPLSKVVGWTHAGDRVRVLVSGGNWLQGTVLDGDELRVRFDAGFEWQIWSTRFMQQLSLFDAPKQPKGILIADSPSCLDEIAPELDVVVPLPPLKDFEEDEMLLAQQYDLLEPLKEGDRVL